MICEHCGAPADYWLNHMGMSMMVCNYKSCQIQLIGYMNLIRHLMFGDRYGAAH